MEEVAIDLRIEEKMKLRASGVLFVLGGLVLAHLKLGKLLIIYAPLCAFLLWRWRRRIRLRGSYLHLSKRGMKGMISVFEGDEKRLLGIFGGRQFFIPWSAIVHWNAGTSLHQLRIRSTDGTSEAEIVLPFGVSSYAGREIAKFRSTHVLGLFALMILTACASAPREIVGIDAHRALVQGVVEKNRFTIDRGISEYADYFGPEFTNDLDHLKPKDHWIDGGSGNAYAQKDFLGSRDGSRVRPGAPRLTAITLKYPEDQPRELGGDRFRVLSGRYFEDIPLTEIAPADVITDVTGIINYTHQLDQVLERYLTLLKPGGKIYVFLPTTTTVVRQGKRLSLFNWLREIPGLEVRELKVPRSPYPSSFSFVVAKAGCGIEIPSLSLTRAAHRVAVIREFTELPALSDIKRLVPPLACEPPKR